MKRLVYTCVFAVLAVTAGLAADVFSQLHITPEDAKQAVSGAVLTGLPSNSFGSAAFKAAPATVRVALVDGAVTWMKSYVASAEFKRDYLHMRDTVKPQPPVFKGTPEDEAKASAPQDPLKDPDTQKMLAALPADQRKQVEDSLKQMTAIIAQQNTPEAQQRRLQMIKADRANRTQTYQTELAKWQKDYPEDPRPLVVRRLHEFLDLSATVDFNAQTSGPNHTGSFVKPEYQAQSDQWKLCFRAGKEATTAARTAVQTWLKELGG